MFGGTSLNRLPSLKITPSDWSIIEADESINGLDKKAKFLYYPVTHLILTSAQWEHRECYPTASSNLNAFRRLVKRIPKNGFFVYQPKDPNNLQLLSSCRGKAIPYHAAQRFNTSLLGQYNQENISSAYTLCQNLGLDHQLILSAIKSYRGISRRVQLLKKTSGIYFFDDFAQSPERIKTVLSALRDSYPNKSIKVFLEAHASFLKTKTTIVNLSQAFQEAQEIVLYRINFSTKISTDKRATFQDFRQSIGDKLVYLPIAKDIYNHYIKTLGSNDIVVHFSSGGLDGIQLFRQIIKHF